MRWPRWRNCVKATGSGSAELALWRRPGAENRGADPHMGRTEPYRQFEISAHPHAETGKAVFVRQLLQQREMGRTIFVRRRYAHQSLHRQLENVAGMMNECARPGRRHARLLLLAGIDLHEQARASAR